MNVIPEATATFFLRQRSALSLKGLARSSKMEHRRRKCAASCFWRPRAWCPIPVRSQRGMGLTYLQIGPAYSCRHELRTVFIESHTAE